MHTLMKWEYYIEYAEIIFDFYQNNLLLEFKKQNGGCVDYVYNCLYLTSGEWLE